jgi:hypothetical protein
MMTGALAGLITVLTAVARQITESGPPWMTAAPAVVGLVCAVWILLPPWRGRATRCTAAAFLAAVCGVVSATSVAELAAAHAKMPLWPSWYSPMGELPYTRVHDATLRGTADLSNRHTYSTYVLQGPELRSLALEGLAPDDRGDWIIAYRDWFEPNPEPLSLVRVQDGLLVGPGVLCDTDGAEGGLVWAWRDGRGEAAVVYHHRIMDSSATGLASSSAADFAALYPTCDP